MGSTSNARQRFIIERKSFDIVLEGRRDDLVRFTEYSKGGRRRSICLSPDEASWFVEAWDSLFNRSRSVGFRKLRTADRCLFLFLRSNNYGRYVKFTEVIEGGPRSIIFPEGIDSSGWKKVYNSSCTIVDLMPAKRGAPRKVRKSAAPPTAKEFPPLPAAAMNFKQAVSPQTSPLRFEVSCPCCNAPIEGVFTIEASAKLPDKGASIQTTTARASNAPRARVSATANRGHSLHSTRQTEKVKGKEPLLVGFNFPRASKVYRPKKGSFKGRLLSLGLLFSEF